MGRPMLNLDINQEEHRGRTAVLTLLLPAMLVLALLLALVGLRDGAEGALARLVDLLPVSYAFAAGMVASVNPCGVLMLPSYVIYQLGAAEDSRRHVARRLLQAVRLALVVTAGFSAVIALVGAVIAVGGQWLATVFSFAGLLIGVGMGALGVWLLTGHRALGIAAAGRVRVTPARNPGNMFLFGIVYAIGSLSCPLPVFLVVVGSALAGGSVAASFGQFLGYALGMGSVILAVTVGTALFRRAISRWLDRLTPYVHRFSALFLMGAGGYLVFHWIFIAGIG
ncbi:MAG: cytochrome c biogenesis protein CcdA [Anaerolineae bacterium]|nr:cytochrome c biogenesis protein CcdA [Anaerolineae bacterium]